MYIDENFYQEQEEAAHEEMMRREQLAQLTEGLTEADIDAAWKAAKAKQAARDLELDAIGIPR